MHEQDAAKTTDSAKYLTIPEAAVRLGVSSDTIRRRIRSKELHASLFARKYRIHVDDLDSMVKRSAA